MGHFASGNMQKNFCILLVIQIGCRARIMQKNANINYEINDNGCPFVSAAQGAFATVRVSGNPDEAANQILIEGNRSGLLAMARWMIALADSDSLADHQHFDNEIGFGFFTSEAGDELVSQRLGK